MASQNFANIASGNALFRPLLELILDSMVNHQCDIVELLDQKAPAMDWGSPLQAWLAVVSIIVTRIHTMVLRPISCTTTFYCHNMAKTITLTTMWSKTLIVNATEMHVLKFWEGLTNICCVSKVYVKHVLVSSMHVFSPTVLLRGNAARSKLVVENADLLSIWP